MKRTYSHNPSHRRKPRKPNPFFFDLSEIRPGARGYRARNGIAAHLYHYITHSKKFRSIPGQAISVPVPRTTTAEAFRAYITNYLRNKKGLLVSTHVESKTEIRVWLRKDNAPLPPISLAGLMEADTALAPLWPPVADEQDIS